MVSISDLPLLRIPKKWEVLEQELPCLGTKERHDQVYFKDRQHYEWAYRVESRKWSPPAENLSTMHLSSQGKLSKFIQILQASIQNSMACTSEHRLQTLVFTLSMGTWASLLSYPRLISLL